MVNSNLKSFIYLAILIVIFSIVIMCMQISESFVGFEDKSLRKYPFHSKKSLFQKQTDKEYEDRLFCYQFPNSSRCNYEKFKYKKNIIDGSQNFPNVDGKNKKFKSLNMFSFNESRSDCCGQSPYFTSSGCVCITPEQKKFIGKNGISS